MTPIDHQMYPHLIDRIFDAADRHALSALRTACRAWKERSDAILVRHIFLFWSTFNPKQGRLQILARDRHCPNGPAHRVPPLRPPVTTPWKPMPVFARHVRVVDITFDPLPIQIPEWIGHLPNVQTVRDVCFPPADQPMGLHWRDDSDEDESDDGEDASYQWTCAGSPFNKMIPPCLTYVTREPLPTFSKDRLHSLRPGARVIISFDDPSEGFEYPDDIDDMDEIPLRTHAWLSNFSELEHEVIILIKPPNRVATSINPACGGAISLVRAILMDFALGLSSLGHIADPKVPHFTLVNIRSWPIFKDGPSEEQEQFFAGFLSGCLMSRWGNDAALESLLDAVTYETLESYRQRIGEELFEYSMGTWNGETNEWVMP